MGYKNVEIGCVGFYRGPDPTITAHKQGANMQPVLGRWRSVFTFHFTQQLAFLPIVLNPGNCKCMKVSIVKWGVHKRLLWGRG